TLAGEDDLFLVKYNAQGNVLWAKSAGSNLDEFASSLSLDPSGNIVIAGYYKSPSLSIGSSSLINAGAEDAFLAKYDPSGNVLWAKNLSGTKRDQANDIHVDKTGSIYMAGCFASPQLIFGATTLSNSGLDDSFITKLDWTTAVSALNEEDWAHVYPNPASDQLYYELSPQAYNARLEVYDMLGKRVLWQKIFSSCGYLDLTGLTNGVYVITLKADYSSFWTGKLTIQK
ncbi:MAG: T9SS type A sorting domain-containing protein, partial [Saprospiraceae bacterium]|nr:T9SS type A sorting domain-containing protein [Saprospiraceae bacterium]